MPSWKRLNRSQYGCVWAGVDWELRLDAPVPGLYEARSGKGPLLGLEGLRARGRSAADALAGPAIVEHGCHGRSVTVRMAPLGWEAAWVTARWSQSEEDAVDLLVELQARTVGRLEGLEVVVLSSLGTQPEAGSHRSVEPRDPHAASLTYDGRETDLSALVSGPPGAPLEPWLVPRSGRPDWTYAELALADDVSRRVLEGRLPFQTARHALFGHDVEKGVVLRARLRGLWLPKSTAMTDLETRFDAFREEPLPLTT